jgi:hypothetical protein
MKAATIAIALALAVSTLNALAQDPGGPPPGDGRPGGPPPRPPGSGARNFKLSGVYTLDGGNAEFTTKTFSASAQDVSAIYVKNGGNLTLVDPQITTTGDTSSDENSSFYGLNAAVLATKGSKVTITGGLVTTSGTGANGVFATGLGAQIILSKVTIKATAGGGHGVMATAGGSLILNNVAINTSDERAAAVATDRGGGTIKVTGGVMKTTGTHSPGIYSTGNITVSDATLTASGAEAVVIEGSNSVALANSSLSGARRCGVMIYQSFSGDAEGRKGTFTMKGGALTAAVGPLFYVTNTTGVIELESVKLSATSGTLMDASAGRWGRDGSNGGQAIITATAETLTGNLTCDKISSITATLRDNTTLTGALKGAALTMDSSSKWNVTEDSILTSLTDPQGVSGTAATNISGNGHDVRYNATLPANKWLGGKTYALAGGGRLLPSQ